MSARIEYAPGEAWCIAAGRVVLVCERDLEPARARQLHADAASVATLEALRALVEAEPTALIGLVDLDGPRALLRRHGVPAAADDAPLPDRYGAEWSLDEADAGAALAAGGLGALEGATLPLEGGVVRVAAVRVAPRADASADAGETVAVPEPVEPAGFGAFGQTLPPAVAADARAAEPAAEVPVPAASAPAEPASAASALAEPAPAEPAPAEPAQFTDTGNPIGGLIDSIPGFIKPAVDVRGIDATTANAAPAPAAEPDRGAALDASAPHAPDAPAPHAEPDASAPHAPEASVPHPQPDASAPHAAPASPPAPVAPAAEGDLGDHDGMTVTADQARALRAERSPQAGPGDAAAPATGPLVLSTLCPSGHVNAPGTTRCGTCGAPIDESSAAQRRRPEIAVAVLTSGERIPLGRGVVIGRRPRSRRVEDGRVPRLVTVDSPSEDISRSHVELRVEDWNLVAIDLSSTNGTLLLREGAAPQRLRPEASTILQLGDRLDLGDAQVVTIESAP